MPTRGTTNPNRLRRMDRWLVATQASRLRAAADPLVVDLGFGASAITAVELLARLAAVRADVRVLGLEIEPERVAAAAGSARPGRLEFRRGGFELAGLSPVIVRAANVLRQYDEAAAAAAWATLRAGLAPGGVLVEGTCDELGRLASWVLLDAGGPISLTLACRLASLRRPSDLAARLPKALIHHNVPGTPIHALLADLDQAWDAAAPLAGYGNRQRWQRICADAALRWPVITPQRGRLGELSIAWSALS